MTTKSCQKQNQVFEVFVTANELQTTEKNVKCHQEGCKKTFVHNGALSMHLVKSHGLVKVCIFFDRYIISYFSHIFESLKRLMVSDVRQCLYFTSDLA